jgi:hypothetical protein
MAKKDLELKLEEIYYETDGVLGTKLLREALTKTFLKKLREKTILEGRGMPFRTPGDLFQNEQNRAITFSNAIILPDGGGSFPSKEEAQEAVEAVSQQEQIELEKIVNMPNRAAMIVVFNDENAKKIGFVKYFASTPADGKEKWAEKNFKLDTGYYRSAKDGKISTSSLESLPIKPTDLVGDEKVRNVKKLKDHILAKANTLLSSGALSAEAYGHIEKIINNSVNNIKGDNVLKNGAQYAPAYDKYLSEILAPISLVTGWLSTGDRQQSESVLLKGKNYSSMKIAFNISPNERLVDSKLVHADGTEVKISSKAGSGAASTITTFNDILKNLKKNDQKNYKDFLEKYPLLSQTLEIISDNDWFDGPVILGKNIGLLKSDDITVLKKIKESERLNLANFKKEISLTENLKEISRTFKGTSPDEMTTAEPGYEPKLHVISAIAKQVVLRINSDPSFDQGIRNLLSKSNMVQINSSIKLTGDKKADCEFVNFEVRYPPVFKGSIKLDAAKNYSATRIRGKISFKMV